MIAIERSLGLRFGRGLLLAAGLTSFAIAQEPDWVAHFERGAQLQRQGQYAEAEAAYLKAKAAVGNSAHNDPWLPHIDNGLCSVYIQMRRLPEAERSCLGALAAAEGMSGEMRWNVFNSLQLLFVLHMQMGNTALARQLLGRLERFLETETSAPPRFRSTVLHDRGVIDALAGRWSEAESALVRARETLRTVEDPNLLALTISDLALIALRKRRYGDAERHSLEGIAILERRFGPDHPESVSHTRNLATVYLFTGRAHEAEPMLQRALTIARSAFGPNDIAVARLLATYAEVLKRLNRKSEAKKMERTAAAIISHLAAASTGCHLTDAALRPRLDASPLSAGPSR